jgi:hypothetical protein
MQTRINHEKYTFCIIKSLKHLKKFKIGRVPYLGLELTMNVIKSQIHLVKQSLSPGITLVDWKGSKVGLENGLSRYHSGEGKGVKGSNTI